MHVPDDGIIPVGAMNADALERMAARESMSPRSDQSLPAETASPDWFKALQDKRHGRHGLWIPRHLEFSRHSRERVLCLGNCLGTDWVHYAMHGAHVTVAAESEWLELIRKNFNWRGLAADSICIRGSGLQLSDESVDVVAANWLDDDEAPLKWAPEVARILKPGGKILALVRACWNIREVTRLRWWQPKGYWTRRNLATLLPDFEEVRVRQRQLRRGEVPGMLRFIPLPIMERLAGNVLVLKAFKPLTATLPMRQAA
jgi:SAM-dependent methyltransferase